MSHHASRTLKYGATDPVETIPHPDDLPEKFRQPESWRWDHIIGSAGARLRFGHMPAATPFCRGHVVIAPGAREMGEKYFETAREFADRGYAVWLLEWRGQGGSDRYDKKKPHIYSTGRFRDHIDDLKNLVESMVKPAAGHAPLFLLGHSLGGNIGVRYLHDHGADFKGAILSAPGLDFKFGILPRTIVRLWFKFLNAVGLGNVRMPFFKGSQSNLKEVFAGENVDKIREALHRFFFKAKPELWVDRPNLKWAAELLESARLTARPDFLRAVKNPVLVGIAARDPVLFREGVRSVAEFLPNGRLVEIAGARHDLFVQPEAARAPWMAHCLDFLDRHSAPAVSAREPH